MIEASLQETFQLDKLLKEAQLSGTNAIQEVKYVVLCEANVLYQNVRLTV